MGMGHRSGAFAAALATAAAVHNAEASNPVIIHVDDDAPAGGDGSTWQTAFNDLQDALDLAGLYQGQSTVELRLADGLYTPVPVVHEQSGLPLDLTDNSADGFVLSAFTPIGTASVSLTSGIGSGFKLLGGYAGLSLPDAPGVRDADQFVSIISADRLRDDDPDEQPGTEAAPFPLPVSSTRNDNAATALTIRVPTGTVVLDGVRLQGATGEGDNGHAVSIDSYNFWWRSERSPTLLLADSRIERNSGAFGVALHANRASIAMSGVVVENNVADGLDRTDSWFGALVRQDVMPYDWNSWPRLSRQTARIVDARFVGNELSRTASLVGTWATTLHVAGSHFEDRTRATTALSVYGLGSYFETPGMITLSDSTFRAGSRLTFGGYGMTVDMIGCQLLDTSLWLAVDRARLANTVIAPPAGAPGITFGDDFRDDRGRQLLIDHVTIATYDDTDAVRIKADALGSAQVYRSVLVSRTQAQEPGEIVFRPPFAFIEVVESYAQILGLPPEQLPGSGLLSEPPALVGPTTGPALTADALRPSLGSSAIDAGTSAQLLGGLDITTDIRGLLRDSTPDVGAFEYVAFLDCPADVNADARLDIDDFSAFVALFFATAAAADINRDSVFDIDDFSAFIDQFFAGC